MYIVDIYHWTCAVQTMLFKGQLNFRLKRIKNFIRIIDVTGLAMTTLEVIPRFKIL